MDKEQIDNERLYAMRIRLTSQNFLDAVNVYAKETDSGLKKIYENEMSDKKELLNRAIQGWELIRN